MPAAIYEYAYPTINISKVLFSPDDSLAALFSVDGKKSLDWHYDVIDLRNGEFVGKGGHFDPERYKFEFGDFLRSPYGIVGKEYNGFIPSPDKNHSIRVRRWTTREEGTSVRHTGFDVVGKSSEESLFKITHPKAKNIDHSPLEYSFSADSRKILSYEDESLHVYDIETKQIIFEITRESTDALDPAIRYATLSASGKYLYILYDDNWSLYEVPFQTPLLTFGSDRRGEIFFTDNESHFIWSRSEKVHSMIEIYRLGGGRANLNNRLEFEAFASATYATRRFITIRHGSGTSLFDLEKKEYVRRRLAAEKEDSSFTKLFLSHSEKAMVEIDKAATPGKVALRLYRMN